MSKFLLSGLVLALMATLGVSQSYGQSDYMTKQIERVKREQAERSRRMDAYMENMQRDAMQRTATPFPETSPTMRDFSDRNFSMPGDSDYDDVGSTSSSSGSYRIRTRGLGKLIGLVVFGALAVGGWLVRMISGGGE